MKKQYQLSEFQFYDGEEFITFNLIDINTEKKEITDASAFTHSTCWKIAAGSTSNTA